MSSPTSTPPKPTVDLSLIALLIAVSAVSPLGINMYLPSTPGMARSLGVDFATIQLTLSLYLAAMAVGQLIIGPLSDRFGRRPVLLIGLAAFVIGSLICMAAPNFIVLILGRVVQAMGGCAGITLGRAIIRDLYDRDQVASMIGYVTMGMAVAPMVAPTIGGALETATGWRAVFGSLAAFAVIALLFAFLRLPETHQGRGSTGSAAVLLRGYRLLVRSRVFWGYALATSFTNAAFFAFLAGAPYVTIELMGRSPAEYGLYSALLPSGYILGNFTTARFARRIGSDRLIAAGSVIAIAGVLVMGLVFAGGAVHPAGLFMPMSLIAAGNGLVLPNAIAGAVSVKPELAGAAAGLSGSFQIGSGALIAPVVGATLSTTVWPLITIMTVSSLLALAVLGLVAGERGRSSGR